VYHRASIGKLLKQLADHDSENRQATAPDLLCLIVLAVAIARKLFHPDQ
jgi:hypothetical protein